jgi:DNA-binding response OmpR family regulator
MKKNIVIIDDCKLTLAIARDILEEAGFDVATAETGIAANQFIFGGTPPDLIVIDVEMPMLNGDQKVTLLKKRKRSSEIPILMISAKPEEELSSLATGVGADGYLCKPLQSSTLLEKIQTLIR